MDSSDYLKNVEFPSNWKIIELGEIFEFTKKPKNLFIDGDRDVLFIPMEAIPNDNASIKHWNYNKYKNISSGSFILKNDLIIAKITPSFENGKQAILSNLPDDFGYATTEVWAMHPKSSEAINNHLFNYIKIGYIRQDLASRMEGSTGRQRLSRNVLEYLTIPLPPLAEQQKISTVLSAVQGAKEKTGEVIRAAKELKKSLMNHLFTYGPVPPQEVPNVKLKETEIGLIPISWEVSKLYNVVINFFGGGTPSTKVKEYWNGNIHWTTSKNINSLYLLKGEKFITEKGLNESSSSLIPKDGMIIGSRVGVGKVAIPKIDVAISQDLTGIIPDKNKIKTIYLAYQILTNRVQNYFKECTRGTTIKGISREDIKNLPIRIPSLNIQEKVAEILIGIDQKVEAEEIKKAALDNLFKTLLENLMTGKTRVNHLDIPIRTTDTTEEP